MFLHGRLKDFRRKFAESFVNFAHQHHGPFDKACDLGQKPLVFNDVETLSEGLLGGVVPDGFGPFFGRQDDMRALELQRVVFERPYRKSHRMHEAVTAGHVAGNDAVDVEVHDLRFARVVRQNADDRMQRAHPAQAATAPAHGFRPWEVADRFFQNFGDDDISVAAGRFNLGVPEAALLFFARFKVVL